jgi:tRNA (adenine22-N1)-methyltransferase
MELSKRLAAIAGLVTEGAVAADVGTDHGYVPIYLAETGKCERVIAMDVNQGPLDRALIHIKEHNLEKRIEIRLSDGLKSLRKGEADTVIAAGMGGGLIIRILEESKETAESIREFILQPQSEIHKVREYLSRNGFCLTEEKMAEEENKFYPMMKLVHGEESAYTELELCYGRKLLAGRDPVLRRFLIKEEKRLEGIYQRIEEQPGEAVKLRCREIRTELMRIRQALALYR